MSTIMNQRDTALKTETWLNLKTLSRIHPMSQELAKSLFKDNALKKLTQHVFYHLSHYLVSVIDSSVCASLPWPLYDSKTERNYRNEFSKIVQDYSNKGLVLPVMSSYFVNPGCYKVVMLIFQLSQLAVNRSVLASMKKDHQKKLYAEFTGKYNPDNKDFIENIEEQTKIMMNSFTKHLQMKQVFEKITQLFRMRIIEMEKKLTTCEAQKYINNLVDNYLKQQTIDDEIKNEILKIKNIEESSEIFEISLNETDRRISELETQWEQKANPITNICQNTCQATEELISRYMGETDKKLYMVEYNHKTDSICTNDLQNEVNSQQKYILKNIVKDERLNFPNLIRGFLISTCLILKDKEIDDDLYKFNECLEDGRKNIKEISLGIRMLVERIRNLEEKVQVTPIKYHRSVFMADIIEIPPLPDFSDLKFHRDHIIFDGFTPFSLSKHQFNLRRKINNSFIKPHPRPFITPFHHHGPRDDFLKNLTSCRLNTYDTGNMSHNVNNISMISHISQTNQRVNETISVFSSGFSKQQMQRLFSTRKTSSSKKHKFNTNRPGNIKTGALFNESTSSIESNGLYRSHSSPNLYENREKRSLPKIVGRKLSVMQEDSPPTLNMSGITAIKNDSGTPQSITNFDIDRKVYSDINLHESPQQYTTNIFYEADISKLNAKAEGSTVVEKSAIDVPEKEVPKTETPKTNPHLIKKTSSLEKIINRFRKVRASVYQTDQREDDIGEIQTIVEEKENFNSVNLDVFSANRVLLPDLLSPNCSMLTIKSTDYIALSPDAEGGKRKPRESLGTMLGVDQTILDQFDLID